MPKVKLSEMVNSVPFDGLSEQDYVDINKLVDTEIEIEDVEFFENDKGPGVFGLTKINGNKKYFCTHSVGVVATLKKVEQAFIAGNSIVCVVRHRKSTKSDRMVYSLE